MQSHALPYMLPLFAAALVSALLAVYVWRRRTMPGALPFVAMMFGVAVWSVGYAFEVGSADLPGKVLAARMQYLASRSLAWRGCFSPASLGAHLAG